MSDRTTAYAAAILEIGRAEGALETVTDELRQLAQAVQTNDQLRSTLTDSQIPVGRRLGLLESDVLGAASNGTRAAVAMLLAADHASDLGDVATELARLAAEAGDRDLAEVTVAVPLDDQRREALRTALERATGKSLELQVVVDPDVVGGVRAIVGDTVYDGSLAGRLRDVRTRLDA